MSQVPQSYLKQPVAPSVESGDDGGVDVAAVEALKTEGRKEKFHIRGEHGTQRELQVAFSGVYLLQLEKGHSPGGIFAKETIFNAFLTYPWPKGFCFLMAWTFPIEIPYLSFAPPCSSPPRPLAPAPA